MIFPSVAPIMAKYAAVAYPETKAQVQAIPMMGMSIGMMLGQLLVSQVPDNLGWFFAAGLCFTATLLLVVGVGCVTRALKAVEYEQYPAGELTEDPIAFADMAAQRVKEYLLSKGGESLKYRPVQALVLARILNCVPDFPPWDEATKGRAVREKMFSEMGEFEGLRSEFACFFRDLGHEQELVADAHDAQGSHSAYNHSMAALTRARRRRARGSVPLSAMELEI